MPAPRAIWAVALTRGRESTIRLLGVVDTTPSGWVVSKIAVRSFSSWMERDCFIPTSGWAHLVIVHCVKLERREVLDSVRGYM